MSARAWRVVAALGVAAVSLAGFSGSANAAGGPFAMMDSAEDGGLPLLSSGPSGMTARFVDRAPFFVGVLLENHSGRAVTIVDAKTPEPPHSLVHQLSTRLSLFTPCTGGLFCPFLPSKSPTRLTPVTVPPGGYAGVRLNYRLGSCADVPHGSFATAAVLDVTYMDGQGAAQLQSFPIGHARLVLEPPAGVECVPRPYSHIGLVGSFTTSPGHQPVRGSDGDTCTKTSAGGLHFESRYFRDRTGVQFRVEIDLPRFRGVGLYATARRADLLGPATVTVTGLFGDRGNSIFQGHPGTVTVTQAASPLFGGRLQATLFGHRRFFSAYGAWRCTTKLS